tara:strand:+ start:664 stop:1611 length:948 start_codon:yes stop_codon:yes gene_type:complete
MSQTATARESLQEQSYFKKLWNSATSTFEGMAVTMANLVRAPITVQYPDRLPEGKQLWEILPERTRGFLEVDTDICTACTLCETNCPIDCIQILIEKRDDPTADKKIRGMYAFDIDMGKCMYCGLCVEPCPTGAIRMTTQFEGSDPCLETMTFRFIPFDGFVVPYKAGKGAREFPTRQRGEIARETLDRMRSENHLLFDYIRTRKAEIEGEAAADDTPDIDPIEAKRIDFTSRLQPGNNQSLFDLLRFVMADTDCGACTLPDAKDDWDCDGYSKGLVEGETTDTERCEPGGDDTKLDIEMIFEIWNGMAATGSDG